MGDPLDKRALTVRSAFFTNCAGIRVAYLAVLSAYSALECHTHNHDDDIHCLQEIFIGTLTECLLLLFLMALFVPNCDVELRQRFIL